MRSYWTTLDSTEPDADPTTGALQFLPAILKDGELLRAHRRAVGARGHHRDLPPEPPQRICMKIGSDPRICDAIQVDGGRMMPWSGLTTTETYPFSRSTTR